MKRVDIFDDLRAEAQLILLTYGISIDIDDDDELYDFVNGDLQLDTMLDWDCKQTIIVYNHLLQMKAFTPTKIKIIAEYDTI